MIQHRKKMMHKKDRNESQRSSLYSPHSTFLSAKLILDLVAREMARKHTAFYNIGFSEAKALFRQKLARKWGHAIARGWATLLLDRLRDFVVVPSSAGGNSSFERHSQSMEERATLDRYHHFHGHSGMCA